MREREGAQKTRLGINYTFVFKGVPKESFATWGKRGRERREGEREREKEGERVSR